ncbi:MAG: TetR/AcrR family transcriptional regulator [Thalassovita sp.]
MSEILFVTPLFMLKCLNRFHPACPSLRHWNRPMPYTPEHRARTKKKVIDVARKQFNLNGFDGVSIDQIMTAAGLSRGGFYHHFKDKEELFAAAVDSFQNGLSDVADADDALSGHALIQAFMNGYLNETQLVPEGGHCPMIAVPSDVSRRGAEVKQSYQRVVEAMLNLFQDNLDLPTQQRTREIALTLCMISVGGMVLARAVDDSTFQNELIDAARKAPAGLGLST